MAPAVLVAAREANGGSAGGGRATSRDPRLVNDGASYAFLREEVYPEERVGPISVLPGKSIE